MNRRLFSRTLRSGRRWRWPCTAEVNRFTVGSSAGQSEERLRAFMRYAVTLGADRPRGCARNS